MKINKKVISLLVAGILTFSFSIMVPVEGVFHESGSDDTDKGPRKQKLKQEGLFGGFLKFFKVKSGKMGAGGGKTNTTVVTGKGGKNADDGGNGTTVAGDQAGGNQGATAGDLAAEKAVGGVGKSFVLPDTSATVQAKGKTLAEKEKLVDNSDLSVMQKAIVKSLADRANDVELLIGAMKNVEMQVIDGMTGTVSHVVSDLNQDDNNFVLQLKRIKDGCEHRLLTLTDDQTGREFDIQKLQIVDALLLDVNKAAGERFFSDDIEPKVRLKKEQLRSKSR